LWESVEERRLHPVDSPFPSQAACVSRGQARITQYRQQFKSTRPGAVIEALDGGLTARVRWQVTSDTRADIAALTDYRKSLEDLLTVYEQNPAGRSLTSEVADFPYAWYLRQVLQKVEERWQRQTHSSEPDQKPLVSVEIRRDGSIVPPRIERTSGNTSYDQAALGAVVEASPFPPLPADWTKPSVPVAINFGPRGLDLDQNAARQRNIDDTRRSIAETDRRIADARAARPTTKWVTATALHYQCWPVGVNPQ
jgi:TonB family protein